MLKDVPDHFASSADNNASFARGIQGLFDGQVSPQSVEQESLIIHRRVSVRVDDRDKKHDLALKLLHDADRFTLRRIFKTLPAPKITEMAGEFDGGLLSQGGRFCTALTHWAFGLHGPWIGKAFYPLNDETGIGYNCFRSGNSIVRKLAMDTHLGGSWVDGRPSLLIRYGARQRGMITRLEGEIRQYTDKIMLGFGFFGITNGFKSRRKIPFFLCGPSRTYLTS